MKRLFMVYTLTLADGRHIRVHANNRVEAFDKMQFFYPLEVEGYSFRDVESHYAGQEVR